MPDGLDFETLEILRKRLQRLRLQHVETLRRYLSEDKRPGFRHQLSGKLTPSCASTSTCISSLVAVGAWTSPEPFWAQSGGMAHELLDGKWDSAELGPNNPFSVAFIGEGVLDLIAATAGEFGEIYPHAKEHTKCLHEKLGPVLLDHLRRAEGLETPGSISIPPYPPSAYLTQLGLRVLRRLELLEEADVRDVQVWSRGEINRQIALSAASSRNFDPLQMAYALIVAASVVPDEESRPEDKEIFRSALKLFFAAQLSDGGWPLSLPLFHYKKVGNAYCYDYELLTQLLLCQPLRDDLLPYLSQLSAAVARLDRLGFDLKRAGPERATAWASGHHPQLEGPESWSTASVYHFLYALDRLVAEAIRRTVFQELGEVYPYSPPSANEAPPGAPAVFAERFLDANLHVNGHEQSLRTVLLNSFVEPIAADAARVARGGRMQKQTAMSAILYGPPGTSKTDLAQHISDYLHWPRVSVDPSYLVKQGIDQIQAMANRLFSMLVASEQIVVLLDEFDEMGRDRNRSQELLSRIITTAMLPKLIEINKERRIVFLLATNFVGQFDAAFSRAGRFDLMVQVMPPTAVEKGSHWPVLKPFLSAADQSEHLEMLTYAETLTLVRKLTAEPDPDKQAKLLEHAIASCTLMKPYDPVQNGGTPEQLQPPGEGAFVPVSEIKETSAKAALWKDRCVAERVFTRLPD